MRAFNVFPAAGFRQRLITRARGAVAGRAWHVGFAFYGLVFAVFLLSGLGSEPIRSLMSNLWYLPIGGASAVLAWQVSRAPQIPTRQRVAWRLVACAALASLVSDAIWIYVENVRREDPSGNIIANLGYLLFYPVLLGGLVLFPRALRSKHDALKFGLDVGIVVVAGTMAVWQMDIAPLVAAHGSSKTASFIELAYAVGDLLLLLGLATNLLRYPRGPRRLPVLLLAGSVTAMMLADVTWASLSLSGSFEAGNIQDLPYLLQYVLFAMAVVEERRRLRDPDRGEPDERVTQLSALPYVAVVGGYTLFVGCAWDQLTGDLLPIAAGAVMLTTLVIVRQIVALKDNARFERERSLLAGEKRFKSLIQHASDVVSIIDDDGRLRFASPSAGQTLGYPAASLIGRLAIELVHPDDADDVRRKLKHLASHPGHILTGRWRTKHSDGRWLQTENTATNLLDDENIRGIVLASRDVTERVSLESRLTHQAFHDPLTGLANRTLFQERVEEAMARRQRDGGLVAVMFLDLDKFKDINDTFGHGFGDAVLRASASRIASVIRPVDTAARIGGDEFSVLLDDPTGNCDPTLIAERMACEFLAPCFIEGREILVTVSVGVAVATPGQTADQLARDADLAMYLAKGRGRGQAAVFEPSLHTILVDRLQLQTDLRKASANGEISLAYQPLHDLKTQALIGAEALMRWSHPTRGAIPPDIFIPIAEETGLIVPLGRWALMQACRDAQRWHSSEDGEFPLQVSVNLSGRQLADPTLVTDVDRALRESALDGSRLVLELTESVLLDHTPEALSVLQGLKTLGIHIAIDDFGTKYSSLSYLQHLPIDELKIDRSFVERIGRDRGTAALTRAIVAMATALSLRTVAEGVQSAEDAEQLRRFGCDVGQGFYFSRPMPTTEFALYARRCRMISAA